MAPRHDPRGDGTSEGLWAPARRVLTTGLVLSTTLIAAEAPRPRRSQALSERGA